MKKRYAFSLKNCLGFGLLAALMCFVSPDLQAQNGPAIQWEKVYGGSDDDLQSYLLKTSDGGYIFGGWSKSGISGDKSQLSFGDSDFWIVKTDANGNKQWEKAYGGNGKDILQRILQTQDGGYLLGGHSTSGIGGDKSQASNGGSDYWIIKIDPNGVKQWDKSFGGNSTEFLYGLLQTADGGYLLGGMSDSGLSGDKTFPSRGSFDFWLLKLDQNGNKQWDKIYGGTGEEYFMDINKTADGGFIVYGTSTSGISSDKSQASYGSYDIWVLKLDANYNIVWDKTLGGNLEDYGHYLKQTSDGGYIVGGTSKSGISGVKSHGNQGDFDYWIIKLDGFGNIQWDKTYGGNGHDELYQIHQVNSGGYIIGGASASGAAGDKTQASFGGFDFWALRLDANGNKVWDKSLGGSQDDHLFQIHLTSDGGYILSGQSESGASGSKTLAGKGLNDYWIVKLAPDVLSTKENQPTFTLSLSPNPNHGKFHLHLSGLTAPTAEVTVTDLLGRVILQQQLKTTNAQIAEELTLPAAANGMYLLQVKVGAQVMSRKIVVN